MPPRCRRRRPTSARPAAVQVLAEDSATNVRWLRLDLSTLKHQLVTLCDTWVANFSGLLATLASRDLASLHAELCRHVVELTGREVEQECSAERTEPLLAPPVQSLVAAVGALAGETRRQACERLEALHAQLEGAREELQGRVAACQQKYEALVGLQARAGAAGRRAAQPSADTGRMLPCLAARRGCQTRSWSALTGCRRCGWSLRRP